MAIFSALGFLFPPPPSLFVTAMSVISFTSLTNAGFKELKGTNMPYSKFWNVGVQKVASPEKESKLSSRNGMLMLYTPAALAGLASFFLLPTQDLRIFLLSSALTAHFFKRVFEVLFIHKYSGWMDVEATIVISLSYFLSAVTMIYTQHLSVGLAEPAVDLKYAGCGLFVVGIVGNFYHHYLLSKLRSEGEKNYKIPEGGLFKLVICPHYLFEILGFYGISCIAQTAYAFSFTLGTTFYLIGRSYATRKWYESKFEDFPNDVKALIPYIF